LCGRQQGGAAEGAGGQGALAPCLWLLDDQQPLCMPSILQHLLRASLLQLHFI